MAHAPLLANARFILKIEGNLLLRMGLGGGLQRRREPFFRKAAFAFSSALGCTGRAFCRDRSGRRTTRVRLAGCSDLPNRSSITPHRSRNVQLDKPSFSGSGPRRMI